MAQAPRGVGVRIRIDLGPGNALGSGKIGLLEAIERGGSLTRAAQALGMSYRRAWGLLRELNAQLGEPVALATVGGTRGGGAQLTPLGRGVIAAYREVEAAALSEARARFAALTLGASAKPVRGHKLKPKGPRPIAKRG